MFLFTGKKHLCYTIEFTAFYVRNSKFWKPFRKLSFLFENNENTAFCQYLKGSISRFFPSPTPVLSNMFKPASSSN